MRRFLPARMPDSLIIALSLFTMLMSMAIGVVLILSGYLLDPTDVIRQFILERFIPTMWMIAVAGVSAALVLGLWLLINLWRRVTSARSFTVFLLVFAWLWGMAAVIISVSGIHAHLERYRIYSFFLQEMPADTQARGIELFREDHLNSPVMAVSSGISKSIQALLLFLATHLLLCIFLMPSVVAVRVTVERAV